MIKKPYPSTQLFVEIGGNESIIGGYYTPLDTGYLEHIRVKIAKRGALTEAGRSYRVMIYCEGALIGQSASVSVDQLPHWNLSDTWYGRVRFDFTDTPVTAGSTYKMVVAMDSVDSTTEAGYIGFAIDQFYRDNIQSGSPDITNNSYLMAEFFLKKGV